MTAASEDGASPSTSGEIQALTPESRGRYLVRTNGTEHVFDLDAFTYQRLPGPGRSSFAYDGEVVILDRIDLWPTLGRSFLLWFDDPQNPFHEHWRRSSWVQSIEPLDAEEAATSETDGDVSGAP